MLPASTNPLHPAATWPYPAAAAKSLVPSHRTGHVNHCCCCCCRYPAYLHITDIAGLVRGASEGAGLGNAFLSHIAAVDGIFHVVSHAGMRDALSVTLV